MRWKDDTQGHGENLCGFVSNPCHVILGFWLGMIRVTVRWGQVVPRVTVNFVGLWVWFWIGVDGIKGKCLVLFEYHASFIVGASLLMCMLSLKDYIIHIIDISENCQFFLHKRVMCCSDWLHCQLGQYVPLEMWFTFAHYVLIADLWPFAFSFWCVKFSAFWAALLSY